MVLYFNVSRVIYSCFLPPRIPATRELDSNFGALRSILSITCFGDEHDAPSLRTPPTSFSFVARLIPPPVPPLSTRLIFSMYILLKLSSPGSVVTFGQPSLRPPKIRASIMLTLRASLTHYLPPISARSRCLYLPPLLIVLNYH